MSFSGSTMMMRRQTEDESIDQTLQNLVIALRLKGVFPFHNKSVDQCLEDFIQYDKNDPDRIYNGRTALSYTAEAADLHCVNELLQHYPLIHINHSDETGRTALSYAATAETRWDTRSQNHVQVAKLLIENKADPASRDLEGRTPLLWAIKKGCMDTVQLFCNRYKGDDRIFAADNCGRTPLHYAAIAEADDKHDRLKPKSTAYIEVLELLIDNDANPTVQDGNGQTPLSLAAQMGCTETVRIFCSRFSKTKDAFAAAPDGSTPLHHVMTAEFSADPWGKFQQDDIHEFLGPLIQNVDPAQQDKNGRTPLSWAAEKGCNKMVKYFCSQFEKDDAIFKADHDGRTPLSYAGQGGHEIAMGYLLCARKIYNDCDYQNRTPLYWQLQNRWNSADVPSKANRRGSADVPSKANLWNFADVSSKANCLLGSFFPWLSIPNFKKEPELQARHLDVVNVLNRSVKGGMTLLSEAVTHNDIEFVRGMMSIPDVTSDAVNDKHGDTALIIALGRGSKEMFDFLCCNPGKSLQQIIHQQSPNIFQEYLTSMQNPPGKLIRDLSELAQDALQEILQLEETEKAKQLLDILLSTLKHSPENLNSLLRASLEKAAETKEISLVQILMEGGGNPAVCTSKENWLTLRPVEARNSLKIWRQGHSSYGSSYGVAFESQKTFADLCCCEGSTMLMHSERDAWETSSKEIPLLPCHTRYEISLLPSEIIPMCKGKKLEQSLWGIQWTLQQHKDQRSIFYNSSLSKVWIPDNITEFLEQFLVEFERKWEEYCGETEDHLLEHRKRFIEESVNSKNIDDLGRDYLYLTHLRLALSRQVKTIEVETTRYYKSESSKAHDHTHNDTSFEHRLRRIKRHYTEEIDRFEQVIHTLSQMEYTRRSINETTLMRRISFVTFIYLPLMYASSLFGMNVDATEGPPRWQWYIPFAITALGITYILWILSELSFGSKGGKEHRLKLLEKIQNTLFSREKVEDSV